jgi:hypothetical protein
MSWATDLIVAIVRWRYAEHLPECHAVRLRLIPQAMSQMHYSIIHRMHKLPLRSYFFVFSEGK